MVYLSVESEMFRTAVTRMSHFAVSSCLPPIGVTGSVLNPNTFIAERNDEHDSLCELVIRAATPSKSSLSEATQVEALEKRRSTGCGEMRS